MKIIGSNITMQATHSKIYSKTTEESLKVWVGDRRPDFKDQNGRESGLLGDSIQLSQEAKERLANKSTVPVENAPTEKVKLELSEEDKKLIRLLEAFLTQITGKDVKLKVPEEIVLPNCTLLTEEQLTQAESNLEPVGWGVEYEYHETEYESEQMSFTVSGVIKGNKGNKINFALEMNMSREYYAQRDFVFRAGDAKKIDPLVINFDGNIPELTDLKFEFDLNADGNEDQISFLKPGSGFLALDKNLDGVINDGDELFGPASGNGFDELSHYDEDQNNWIDDKDSVFQNLRIWSKDSSGADKLIALSDAGVGAIYLGHINTPFELKNKNNQLNGMVQKTGIYVTDHESVGTIQQIDLTV